MITDTIKDFKNGTLNEKTLVKNILTELGSSFYMYMRFLEQAQRKSEEELIKKIRDIIFGLRDKEDVTYQEIDDGLTRVRDNFNIQLIMLKTNPTTAWEVSLFSSITNDILGAIHFFKDNSK